MKSKNKLIVLEGIDGVGKTTVAKELKRLLRKKRIPAVLYEDYEKRYSPYNKLKPFMKNAPTAASHLFYLSSSVYKSHVIKKLLKRYWVICDRYVYSTMARHKALGSNIKINVSSLEITKPDYAFLLTVKEKVRTERVKQKERIMKADLVPKIPGLIPHKMEILLRAMRLIQIDNSGSLDETMNKISRFLFS